MNSLDWLVGHHFRSLEQREHDWVLTFAEHSHLAISCLWRLLEGNQIQLTSSDHGHTFGRSSPLDARAEITCLLGTASVASVALKNGTLDLEIGFDTGHAIQILPDSSGYESWTATNRTTEFTAAGGGKLIQTAVEAA